MLQRSVFLGKEQTFVNDITRSLRNTMHHHHHHHLFIYSRLKLEIAKLKLIKELFTMSIISFRLHKSTIYIYIFYKIKAEKAHHRGPGRRPAPGDSTPSTILRDSPPPYLHPPLY